MDASATEGNRAGEPDQLALRDHRHALAEAVGREVPPLEGSRATILVAR